MSDNMYSSINIVY